MKRAMRKGKVGFDVMVLVSYDNVIVWLIRYKFIRGWLFQMIDVCQE